MSLAPKWAKEAAVLGLRMQLLQLKALSAGPDNKVVQAMLEAELNLIAAEIRRLEAMPN